MGFRGPGESLHEKENTMIIADAYSLDKAPMALITPCVSTPPHTTLSAPWQSEMARGK